MCRSPPLSRRGRSSRRRRKLLAVVAAGADVAAPLAGAVVPLAAFGVSVALLPPQAASSAAPALAAVPARIVRRDIVVLMGRSFLLSHSLRPCTIIAHG